MLNFFFYFYVNSTTYMLPLYILVSLLKIIY